MKDNVLHAGGMIKLRELLGLVTRVKRVTDNVATGMLAREIRERHQVSLRAVARELNLSAPYVSDLELGRRGWTEERCEQYRTALQALTGGEK